MSSQFIVDPDIYDWCDELRVQKLIKDIQPAAEVLRWSQEIKSVVFQWTRLELIKELIQDDELWSEIDKTNYLNEARQRYIDSTSNEDFKPPVDLKNHKAWFLADEILSRWSRRQWEHRLETLYLNQKHNLDQVSCSILRVKNQYLAFELFQRLQCKEMSFEQLSWKYGEGKERSQGGLFIRQRLSAMPDGLREILRKSRPGKVLKPRKMGDWFVLISLEEFSPAQFDAATQDYLLRLELKKWLHAVTNHLIDHLK